jgi:hypothetical protein
LKTGPRKQVDLQHGSRFNDEEVIFPKNISAPSITEPRLNFAGTNLKREGQMNLEIFFSPFFVNA